jgi:hypothetical protein
MEKLKVCPKFIHTRDLNQLHNQSINSQNSSDNSIEINKDDVVVIKWVDAVTEGGVGWSDLDETMTSAETAPPIMATVGIILHSCPTHVSVTDSKGEAECGHMTKIPREMIKDISKLTRLTHLMTHEDIID